MVLRSADQQVRAAGGQFEAVPAVGFGAAPGDLLAVDELLDRLTANDPTAGQLLKMRYFAGLSVGLAFQEQIMPELPVLDHDVPLSMLVTDRGIRRFASANLIRST